MKIEYKGKSIRIPDETIKNYMDSLELSKQEAIQMYLEEEGIAENEDLEALEEKAKKSKITATIHGAEKEGKKTNNAQKKERKRKEDIPKREIIAHLHNAISELVNVENAIIQNPEKLISFQLNGANYEIDLRRKRKKKEVV